MMLIGEVIYPCQKGTWVDILGKKKLSSEKAVT